jgi:hypothetical protein
MANTITLAKDFDASKISYSDVKVNDNGGKTVYVSYDKAPLILQTPQMSVPFGLQKWDNDNRIKYTLSLSFKGMDRRNALQSFYSVFETLDSKFVKDGFDNQQSWFKGKKLTSPEVVEALYTPLIQMAKDKNTGEPTDKYPPTFKVTVPSKDGNFICEVYDDKRNQLDLSGVETKGSNVTAIIQCMGLWMAGGKFGSSWKVLQMQVVPNQRLRSFAFVENPEDKVVEDDLDDDEPDAKEIMDSAVEKSDDDEVEEDNNVSDSEDELEKPVAKKAVKKVVMKRKT